MSACSIPTTGRRPVSTGSSPRTGDGPQVRVLAALLWWQREWASRGADGAGAFALELPLCLLLRMPGRQRPAGLPSSSLPSTSLYSLPIRSRRRPSDGDRAGRGFPRLGSAGCSSGRRWWVPPACCSGCIISSDLVAGALLGGGLRPLGTRLEPGMRILFGVQGTGSSRISRSRTLARALKARGSRSTTCSAAVPPTASLRDDRGIRGLSPFPVSPSPSHQGKISGLAHPHGSSPLRFWRRICAPSTAANTIRHQRLPGPITAHAARR